MKFTAAASSLDLSRAGDGLGPAAERPGPARLPAPAGPLTGRLFDLLAEDPAAIRGWLTDRAEREMVECHLATIDAVTDDDLHLALYACYELHYRGFAGVDAGWEWSPRLLELREPLEAAFLGALRSRVTVPDCRPEALGATLFELEQSDRGPSLSRYLETSGTLAQFREFVVHRSAYQLKEADPHSWAIPRLDGPPKAALLEVQADEYGGGRAERMHSTLFAKTMRGLGLDPRPGRYLDRLPGVTLATVNLMSALGLKRSTRGAIVGHLAMFEITSARPNRAYANALRRLGTTDPETLDFYEEHVEADAVHENIAAYDLAGGLARSEPELTEDILFGAAALLDVEARFARHLLDRWARDESSLRAALDGNG